MPVVRSCRSLPAEAPALTVESLYREHFDFVYRIAARLGGPCVDAEDAAQEVFVVVQRRLKTFNNTSLVTTWLYGITVNIVSGMRRSWRRRAANAAAALAAEVTIESLDSVEVRDAYRIAYAILDKLSAKKREVFILSELEGLRPDEIAQLVGTKTETVWSRLHYARQEFAARLARRFKNLGQPRKRRAAS
jgi:RNA polymerase sigma-70 factor (ECF subfamily)